MFAQPGEIFFLNQGVFLVEFFLACHLIHTEVVGAPLHDGKSGTPFHQWFQGIDQTRKIPVDQLALQRNGGGGDDNGGIRQLRMPNRRN